MPQPTLLEAYNVPEVGDGYEHPSSPGRGRTPMSLIVKGQVNEVIGVLAGLESGAFI